MRPRARATLAAAVLVALGGLAPARPARAVTKLEGSYQLMLDIRKTQRVFPWDFESNNNDTYNGAELRLFTQPRANTEAFFKIEADWRTPENSSPRPEFQFREAHVKYQWTGFNRGASAMLFSRQDRFWVDNFVVRVVEGDQLKNDRFGPNAQGVRVDTWGYAGMNTAFVLSDFSDQANPQNTGAYDGPRGTDDVFIVRGRREFPRYRLRTGFTFARKQENELAEIAQGVDSRADVYALDARLNIRGVDVSVEYLESRSPASAVGVANPQGLDHEFSILGQPMGFQLPDRSVLVAELRSLRFGTHRAGYIAVTPVWWSRGALYDNRVGDAQSQQTWFIQKNDETGFKIDSYYLFPERAITFSNSWKQFSRRVYEVRDDWELYNELYVEFVNGFTGKTYLRHYHIDRTSEGVTRREEYRDWFSELQVESQLAWLRFQTKFKDIGLPFAKQLYAVETRVNLSDKLKLYNRFTFGNDASILRKGIFSQLQYRPTGNLEMFLEYGPGWIGDDATPVNDGDLAGGGDQVDIVKFILKGWF